MAEISNSFQDLNPNRGLSFRGTYGPGTLGRMADYARRQLFSGSAVTDELVLLTGMLYGYTPDRHLQPLSDAPVAADVRLQTLTDVNIRRDRFEPEYLAVANFGGSVLCTFTEIEPFEQYSDRIPKTPLTGVLMASHTSSERKGTISHFAIELNKK